MLTDTILDAESVEELDNTRLQHAKLFFKERLQRIIGALVIIGAVAVFFGLLALGKKGFLVGFAVGAGMASLFCVPYTFWQLYRIRSGPPRAPTTPEESIRKYLGRCLLAGSSMEHDEVGMEGYLYLLNGTKRDFGDVEAFKKYWREVNYSVRKELSDKLDYHHNKLLAAKVIEGVSVQHSGERIATCTTTLKIEVGWTNGKLATEGLKMGRVGLVYYQVEMELGKVGERWYIASGKWSGTVTNALKGSDQKFKYIL